MNSSLPVFREPTTVEKIFNRVFGFLIEIEIGFSYNYLLQARSATLLFRGPGSPAAAFVELTASYPVFELLAA